MGNISASITGCLCVFIGLLAIVLAIYSYVKKEKRRGTSSLLLGVLILINGAILLYGSYGG